MAAEAVKDEKRAERARNKAYAAATTRLRDLNRGQFTLLLEEEYAKVGLSVRRRKTAEERAAEAAEKARARGLKAEARRLAKIEAHKAAIAALEADPLF